MAIGGPSLTERSSVPTEVSPVPDRHPALSAELADGELTLTGRLTQASNATFLAELQTESELINCVYKPIRGERPLWDFPRNTLAMREVAAYRLSQAAGFELVPVTTLVDGPLGLGSLQVWVDTDAAADPVVDVVRSADLPRTGYFEVIDGLDADDQEVTVIHADEPQLRRMAIFDALINNADRKGGHILVSKGSVFGVDHGVTFNVDHKLRTLLWGWAAEPLAEDEKLMITHTLDVAAAAVTDLLAPAEIEALAARGQRLLREGHFPAPSEDWPSIPWPPF